LNLASLSRGNEIARKIEKIDCCLESLERRFDEAFEKFIIVAGIQAISDDALKNKVSEATMAYYNAQKEALEKEFESL